MILNYVFLYCFVNLNAYTSRRFAAVTAEFPLCGTIKDFLFNSIQNALKFVVVVCNVKRRENHYKTMLPSGTAKQNRSITTSAFSSPFF